MNASDTELLRQFARDGSEAAFAELVRRHVDLVYSAALRQVDFDTRAAEDITQAVFTALARKAAGRTRLSTVAGWLYGSTRYEAMLYRRTESRRVARETAAHAMSHLLATAAPEPDWDRLYPVLDEAMCDLPEADREAVHLRYFEKRPLAEIGTRLGLSENTARMRVDRALDKLHTALKKRGITSTAAALGTVLGGKAIASAPADLADRVSRTAASTWQRKRPALADGGPGWLIPLTVALLIGISGLMWVNRQGWLGRTSDSTQSATTNPSAETDSGPSTNRLTDSLITDHSLTNTSDSSAEGAPWTGPELVLKIITKDTGQPVPNVKVSALFAVKNQPQEFTQFDVLGTGAGIARIRIVPGAASLRLATAVEGFADTVLRWNPERGQAIPTNYTLRVERGVLIGGRVLEHEEKPVAGARLTFDVREKDSRARSVESLEFQPFETTTDENGRWGVQRIAESMLVRIGITARGADYHATENLTVRQHPEEEKSLRATNHLFHLSRGYVVRGIVLDPSENPVAAASVSLTDNYDIKTTQTGADGTFQFSGVMRGGSGALVATAEGLPSKLADFSIEPDMKPLRIILGAGRNLRLRLLDQGGAPVTEATASLTQSSQMFPDVVLRKFQSETRPDAEGRILWTNASAWGNRVSVAAEGHLDEPMILAVADDIERTAVLVRKPVIRGNVTDAKTGEPVPKFTLVFGHEQQNVVLQRSRFLLTDGEETQVEFTDGAYRHELKRRGLTTVGHNSTPWDNFVIRFEADGYRPQVSRSIRYDEGEVILDVALEPAPELEVTILDTGGRPAVGADVGFLRRGRVLWLNQNLQLFHADSEAGDLILRSDSQGKVKLDRNPDVERIVALNSTGYAETSFALLEEEPVIRLQEWGRIEGRIKGMSGTAYESASLTHLIDYAGLFINMSARAGADGRFLLTNVPPGNRTVVQNTSRIAGSSPGTLAKVRVIEVKVAPGETTRVTLGGDWQVTGRLRLPESASVPDGATWMGILGMPLPQPPPGLGGDFNQIALWNARPENRLATQHAEQVPVAVSTNGVFVAEGVNPGTYRLKMKLAMPVTGRSSIAPLYSTDVEVVVPEQPGSGEINLGEVMAGAASR